METASGNPVEDLEEPRETVKVGIDLDKDGKPDITFSISMLKEDAFYWGFLVGGVVMTAVFLGLVALY